MRSRQRQLSHDEISLWRRAVRDAQPLARTAVEPSEPESDPPAPVAVPAAPSEVRREAGPGPSQRPPPGPAGGIDRRSWQRLRRGRLTIDGRLDLHGLTQSEAHAALARFVAQKQRAGARCVLLITGRGARSGGVLRTMTPRWLEEPPNRERVLAYSPARVQHGGDGALYVLLRRPR